MTTDSNAGTMTTETEIVDLTGKEAKKTSPKAKAAPKAVDVSGEVKAYGAAATDEDRAKVFDSIVKKMSGDETVTDAKAAARAALQRRGILSAAQAA